MKKNKKTLNKLTLNKKVISNLEENQVNGGTNATQICPVETTFCPRNTWICPIDSLLCTIDTWNCPI